MVGGDKNWNQKGNMMNELELLKTEMPSKEILETQLEKWHIKRGSGAGPHYSNYEKAKQILCRYWNLSGQDYDESIKIICEYLNLQEK